MMRIYMVQLLILWKHKQNSKGNVGILMVTIKDVANEAEVSVGSVSRYLNGYTLKNANQARIKEAIAKLNYVQNQTAKSLKMNKSFSIGVIVDTMDNFYSAQLIATLEKIFDDYEYFLLLTSHRHSKVVFERKLNKLIERSVDALIIVKADPTWDAFSYLDNLEIPVISVETPLPNEHISAVLSDDRSAASQVVEKFLTKFNKTAFVVPSEKDYVLEQRIAGIKDAFTKRGIMLSNKQVVYAEYGTEEAYEFSKELVKQGYHSIFVTTYTNTLLAIKAIQDMGKVVGKDVYVACFGYAHLVESMNMPITVVQQAVTKVASLTAENILELLDTKNNKNKKFVQKNLVKNKILWQKEFEN